MSQSDLHRNATVAIALLVGGLRGCASVQPVARHARDSRSCRICLCGRFSLGAALSRELYARCNCPLVCLLRKVPACGESRCARGTFSVAPMLLHGRSHILSSLCARGMCDSSHHRITSSHRSKTKFIAEAGAAHTHTHIHSNTVAHAGLVCRRLPSQVHNWICCRLLFGQTHLHIDKL